MRRLIVVLCLLSALSMPAWAQTVIADRLRLGSAPCLMSSGSADPEGAVAAATCSTYYRTNGAMYVKASSPTASTGWVLAGTVTGSGTTNYIPKWTSSTGLGDSVISTSSGIVSIASGTSLETSYSSGWAGGGYLLDYNKSVSGQSYLEVDKLNVRGTMGVYELLVHQIRATNGSIFVANTGKAKTVTALGGASYRIVTETDHGFAINDLIRAQRFTGTDTYQSDLTVTGVGSTTSFTATLRGGTTVPASAMEYVRLGNTSDASRQGSIYMTADETNAPYLTMFANVAAWSDWAADAKMMLRLGNLNGVYSYGSDTYGLAIGKYANGGSYVAVDATNGVYMNSRIAGTNYTRFWLKADGSGLLANGNIAWDTTGATTVAGWAINATSIASAAGDVGLSSAVTGGDDIRIWAGHATPASAPFKVTEAGVVTASSGTIGGFSLTTTTLSSGTDADYVMLSSGGTNAIQVGDSTFADAKFSVTSAGAMKAISGTIGGFTIGATELYAGSGATRVEMKSNGGFWAGATAFADAPFRVGVDGALTATNAAIDGTLSAAGGTVTINSNGITLTAGSGAANQYNFSNGLSLSGNGGNLVLYNPSGPVMLSVSTEVLTFDGSKLYGNAGALDLGSSGNYFNYVFANTIHITPSGTTSDYYPLVLGASNYVVSKTDGLNETSCGAGVDSITFEYGIATGADCTSPLDSPAALRAEINDLRHQIAELRALLLGGVK